MYPVLLEKVTGAMSPMAKFTPDKLQSIGAQAAVDARASVSEAAAVVLPDIVCEHP